MDKLSSKGYVMFAGSSHPAMAKLVVDYLGVQLGRCNVYQTGARETIVEVHETVRGKDVYLLQTGTQNVNNDIMELLIFAYACKTASARTITAVIPYLPYSKHSKMRKRGSITAKLLAKMMVKAGVSHVLSIDLPAKEIQGFYDVPVDNLRASPFLIQYITEQIPDYRNAVIVARNATAMARATSYAERLRLAIAVIHGADKSESERDDGRSSPPLTVPPSRGGNAAGSGLASGTRTYKTSTSGTTTGYDILPFVLPKQKAQLSVVGDVGGKIAIIVDNMVDDVEQFINVADVLRDCGAYKIYLVVTHGLLSGDAQKLENSQIDEIVVANTIPHEMQKLQCHKLKTIDVSVIISEAIRRIQNNESLSYLFSNIGTDD